MNNQARASRHASGILPSKQFFAPRKPITQNASIRRKPSVIANSPNTPPSPGAQSITTKSSITSAIGSQLLNISSEEVSLLQQPNSLALATLSTQSSSIVNNPSLDQSIDTIFNSDASIINQNSTPDRPPSALLLRRQQRQQSGEGESTELSQAVIDSVMEPITPVPVLEPSSYRQLMRQATANAGSDLSSKDFAAATAFSRHSDVSSNTPTSNTKLSVMSSKKLNPSPAKQSTFNPYALIKMPRIISPHSSSTDYKGQKRLYQVWPGRNRFFLGGRIMTSRDFPAFLVAFSALVVPSGLFMGFTCPFLFDNVSPAVVFVFIYLFLLAVTSMLRTSWSDPGIIPRDLDPSPPTEHAEDPGNAQNNSNFAYDQARSFPLSKEVKINGQTIRLKYCETCKIYRPPRCSHCRQCDNCVENEDHHCIWLNNCIGRRNYRTFFTFIATATILCIYVLGFCLAHLFLLMKQNPKYNFLGAIMKAPVSFLLVVLSFFLMWSVGGLTGYHMYLISNNLTTHEQIRVPMARRNGNRNPFDFRNICKNCLWVLCRPMSRSSVSKRAYIVNENLREEIRGTRKLNEDVSNTVTVGEVNTSEIDHNALGEGDIRVDIKEVITFNNDNVLNELQPHQKESNNIKEDIEPTNLSAKTDENISVPNEKDQIKELHTSEPITTEPSQQKQLS